MTTIVYSKVAPQNGPHEVMRLWIRMMGKLAAMREEHDEDVWELWGALEDQPVRWRAEAAEYDARRVILRVPCPPLSITRSSSQRGRLG